MIRLISFFLTTLLLLFSLKCCAIPLPHWTSTQLWSLVVLRPYLTAACIAGNMAPFLPTMPASAQTSLVFEGFALDFGPLSPFLDDFLDTLWIFEWLEGALGLLSLYLNISTLLLSTPCSHAEIQFLDALFFSYQHCTNCLNRSCQIGKQVFS